MNKMVGMFVGRASDQGYPHVCEIHKDKSVLSFDHRDLADLEHLVKEMRKSIRANIVDRYKEEV